MMLFWFICAVFIVIALAFILPTAVLVPALIGLLFQQTMCPAEAPAKK